MMMKTSDASAITLLVVVAINWGLYGINNLDLVELLGGWGRAPLTPALYLCLALAAIQKATAGGQVDPRWSAVYEKS